MNKKRWEISFLIVGSLTILEFIFVQGMFTWLIAVTAASITGLINIALQIKDRQWSQALLYFISTIALCMGYFLLV